jgi:hypothetical protein
MAKKRFGCANGFSMIELMIGAGLIGLIVLFVAQFGTNFSKNRSDVQKFVEQSSFGAYGTRFTRVAETADLSSLFLHLPISTSCSSLSAPCLQKIDPITGETSSFSANNLPKNFEFYRDTEGVFVQTKANSSKSIVSFDAYSFTNKILTNTAMTAAVNQASVVWPLTGTSSPEFPVLTRSASDVSFSFVASTASSAAPAGQQVLASYITGKTGSLSDLLGSPVIVYNPYYPQQYVVQFLSEIVACKTNISLCKQKFPYVAATINDNHVMLVLKEIEPNQYGNFAPNLKNYSLFASTASGDWSYLFPTKTPNLKAITSVFSSDLASPLAIPKWAHFYDANAMSPYDLFIMPVRWSVYYLKNVPDKPDYFSLIRKDFNGLKNSIETLEVSLLKGSVTFSRKIGTKNLKFSVYGEAE